MALPRLLFCASCSLWLALTLVRLSGAVQDLGGWQEVQSWVQDLSALLAHANQSR